MKPDQTMGRFSLFIEQDPDVESPDSWGDEDLILYAETSRHYKIGLREEIGLDATDYMQWGAGYWAEQIEDLDPNDPEEAADIADILEEWKATYSADWKVYPIRLTDLGSRGSELCFCEYDRHNGFVFVRDGLADLEKLAAVVDPSIGITNPKELAECLLAAWNQYLSGDIWWFRIEDEHGDVVDSCGGFYGYESCEEDGKSTLEHYAKKGAEQ